MRRCGISGIEFCMIVATLAILALSLVPSCFNTLDAIAVERTARILDTLNASIANGEFETDLANTVWHRAVLPDTLATDTTNGVTVVLSLRSGERRVSAADTAAYK